MGPGLYPEIGKKARDLLYRDYQTDQKFSLTTVTSNGVAITATGTKKSDLIFGEIQSQLKNKNVTVDVKTNSESNVFTTITIDELATPGLKSIISFVVPDQKSGKVELQYLHEYAGVNASIGFTANPIVNLSGVFGTGALSVGADVSLDTATGNFSKYNAGLSLTNADLIASLTLNNKGDSMSASYYHLVSPLSSTAVGAELTRSFSSNENTLTFGTQHALDPLTLVKARVNNYGKVSGLIHHQFRPKSFVSQQDPSYLRRPLVSSPVPIVDSNGGDDVEKEEGVGQGKKARRAKTRAADEWVDWEDQILEDTVPLVGFVRMILFSKKYDCGDRLIPEHEQTVLERLLPYHPEAEKKIGIGIDCITVGLHPEFKNSRCMFIVRKDGEVVDFSYWKCIKGLIRERYPLYADSFILRHFKRRRQAER